MIPSTVKSAFNLLFFLIFTFTLFSCSPARKTLKVPVKKETAEFLVQKLKENELHYSWLSAKFSADYENNGKENSFSGQIRIRKDSLIWISLTPLLGIEAVRLIITRDSVKMINRLNDTYFTGDYNLINKFLDANIDYDLLQAFLLGNDLGNYESEKFRACVEDGRYKLANGERKKMNGLNKNSSENQRVFLHDIWLDPVSFKITRASIKETGKENTRLESAYGPFETVDNQILPLKSDYTISAAHTIRVNVEFSKINLDKPQQFPFKIPSNYTPLH